MYNLDQLTSIHKSGLFQIWLKFSPWTIKNKYILPLHEVIIGHQFKNMC